MSVSPTFFIVTCFSICLTMTSICLSLMLTPWSRKLPAPRSPDIWPDPSHPLSSGYHGDYCTIHEGFTCPDIITFVDATCLPLGMKYSMGSPTSGVMSPCAFLWCLFQSSLPVDFGDCSCLPWAFLPQRAPTPLAIPPVISFVFVVSRGIFTRTFLHPPHLHP